MTRSIMILSINFNSAQPAYLQLVDQVKAAAAAGAAKAGDSLPSVRQLAEQLRLNRNTVAKAYTELESQGVIETAAGKGCFIRANRSPFNAAKKRDVLVPEIDSLVVKAHHLQVGNTELLKLIDERLDALAVVRQKHSTQKT